MTTTIELQELDDILRCTLAHDQLVTLMPEEPIQTERWTYYALSLYDLHKRLHAVVKEEIERRSQAEIEALRIASGTEEQARLEVAAADELIRRALFPAIPPDPSLPQGENLCPSWIK